MSGILDWGPQNETYEGYKERKKRRHTSEAFHCRPRPSADEEDPTEDMKIWKTNREGSQVGD